MTLLLEANRSLFVKGGQNSRSTNWTIVLSADLRISFKREFGRFFTRKKYRTAGGGIKGALVVRAA